MSYDETLIEDEDMELSLDELEEVEEEENEGHRVQTFNSEGDGTDNYFDEQYFDE